MLRCVLAASSTRSHSGIAAFFGRLTSLENLEELSLPLLWFDHVSLTRWIHQREGKRVAPKLTHLAIQISSQGAQTLFKPILSRLTSLTIGLLNSRDVWFTLIGRLTTLRSLIIHSSVKKFASPHFEALGNLHALEKLTVSLPMDPGEDKLVTQEQFSTLTSGMPLLRSLEFKVRLRLSLVALTSVAMNCPLLEVCRLATPVDITAWT